MLSMGLGVIVLIGVGIVVLLLIVFVVGGYNGLVTLRNRYKNAYAQIDVQLKRRYDLIPNLVNTVKGSMEFEKETLEAVVSARSRAMQVASGAPAGALPDVKQVAAAEAALTGAMGRFFAVMEAYPNLRSSENIQSLQEELASTENKIAFARQFYNDVATKYNTKQQQFPTNLVAGLAKAQVAELWEIEDAAERQNVKVDLSMGKKPQA